jgi:hypothetical protein
VRAWLSSVAAATTAVPRRRPGVRVNLSIGPDTEIAAMTAPSASRTGADTEATPASRSPTLAAHPRLRTPDSTDAENAASCMNRAASSA